MNDEKRKPGRPKGTFKEECRIKKTITLPPFWWDRIASRAKLLKTSQPQVIQRALESYFDKIEEGE